MNSENPITDMHLDVLKEIGNIGAAHAATSLSQLLDRKIDMHVPNVELVSFDEMFDLAGGAETDCCWNFSPNRRGSFRKHVFCSSTGICKSLHSED